MKGKRLVNFYAYDKTTLEQWRKTLQKGIHRRIRGRIHQDIDKSYILKVMASEQEDEVIGQLFAPYAKRIAVAC